MKLIKTVIDKLPLPESGQAIYRDDVLQGFALRVTAGGTKTFVIEKRINKKVRRKKLGRYGEITAEEARKLAKVFLGKVAHGIDPIAEVRDAEAQEITLREVVEDYLRIRSDLSEATVKDYRRHLREAFADWADRPLQCISKDAVARRHARLGERSHARANNAMRVLRALFNFAVGQYEDSQGRSLFPENPTKRLTHTRAWFKIPRRRTYIKTADLPAWYAAVDGLRHDPEEPQGRTVGDFLLLILFTGMRRSEAMTLRWDNIDLVERTLTVPDTKNGVPLVLPLSDFLYELLSTRRAMVTSPFVFPGEGEFGHLVEPRPQMRKVTRDTGISFRLHDLRRTYITAAESLDISAYALKRLVNHSVGNDVTAGYIISDVERLRAPMQRTTDFLLSVSGVHPPTKVVTLGNSAQAMDRVGGL